MKKLRQLLKIDDISNYELYKYGLYLCTVYADIKGISKRKINAMYQELIITSRKEINITGNEISNILGKKPGEYIKEIIDDIEKNIINGKLKNDNEILKKYITETYK